MNQTRPRFTLVRSSTLGALAALSILVACEARLPTSAEVEKMDVASAEKALVQAKMLDEKAAKNVVYKVDGLVVTADEAHAIAANRIATVNVTKGVETGTKEKYSVVSMHLADSDRVGAPMKVTFTTGKHDGTLETPHGTLEQKRAFTGILFVDGVQKPESALGAISPNDIVSIDVLKGAAATSFSTDPAAANGVIKVTTKHAKQ